MRLRELLFKKKIPNISQHSLSGHETAGIIEYNDGIIANFPGKETTDKYVEGIKPLNKYVTWNLFKKVKLSVPNKSQKLTKPPQKV